MKDGNQTGTTMMECFNMTRTKRRELAKIALETYRSELLDRGFLKEMIPGNWEITSREYQDI